MQEDYQKTIMNEGKSFGGSQVSWILYNMLNASDVLGQAVEG